MSEKRPKSVVIEEKRKVFADAILTGHNQSDAARAAGYHPSQARNVMREEDVQVYIEQARSEVSDLSTLKRLDVVNIVMEAVDRDAAGDHVGRMVIVGPRQIDDRQA